MKSFIKNNLKVFVTLVISGIIFTGIGVYAASQYFAKDITFTPTNENFKKENGESIDNVEDALNELYNNCHKDNENLINGVGEMKNGYDKYSEVELGFKPKVIVAYIKVSDGSRVDYLYVENYTNSATVLTNTGKKWDTAKIIVNDNGFSWQAMDSTWGNHNIVYYVR